MVESTVSLYATRAPRASRRRLSGALSPQQKGAPNGRNGQAHGGQVQPPCALPDRKFGGQRNGVRPRLSRQAEAPGIHQKLLTGLQQDHGSHQQQLDDQQGNEGIRQAAPIWRRLFQTFITFTSPVKSATPTAGHMTARKRASQPSPMRKAAALVVPFPASGATTTTW